MTLLLTLIAALFGFSIFMVVMDAVRRNAHKFETQPITDPLSKDFQVQLVVTPVNKDYLDNGVFYAARRNFVPSMVPTHQAA